MLTDDALHLEKEKRKKKNKEENLRCESFRPPLCNKQRQQHLHVRNMSKVARPDEPLRGTETNSTRSLPELAALNAKEHVTPSLQPPAWPYGSSKGWGLGDPSGFLDAK